MFDILEHGGGAAADLEIWLELDARRCLKYAGRPSLNYQPVRLEACVWGDLGLFFVLSTLGNNVSWTKQPD